MKRKLHLLALLSLACGLECTAQVVAPAAKLQLVADGFGFTEGPAMDAEGNVFFTDQPNNRIWKYDTKGKLSIFMEPAGRANGLYFDNEGYLIACADEQYELWRIGMDKQVEKLAAGYDDSLFNGPNDVWVSPSGLIYFTDPYYQRNYWSRTEPDMPTQGLYLYKNGQVIRLDDQFKKPNGIIGTPDGKMLYVADIGDSKIYRYRVERDGSLTDKQLFASQGSDGMTIDSKGNIYLTGKGVDVYNPQGERIEHIDVPVNWTANVCFGGRDRDYLFITATDKVFILKMQVKGGY
ncbi:SMP-30/gluconolactonase/LRE family protein [Parapedobacter sp. ISTM3]|uniref:Gluconolactonase n=1 Tax=Parapedobacter luteus TaxID=623280 RepID=A0A1T5AYL4_9SPHI|nr:MULTISPECIES: SMP-30/gluconolactonase/LRE family protein [Parapedobacter]MBK1440373.1 SMP-30/gluconolactonase/LRE family protein [Parapedobacter sp. ISTM3]SKB40054.1 gluconolactonase [Parapedobacter luteus]